MHRYTDEQKAYLAEIVVGRSHREITEMMNERFDIELTVSQIKGTIARERLHTGRTGCFPKGNVPANKGTKGVHHGSSTSFRKGNVPANRVPIGSEKQREDGYVWVKVCDGQKNDNWRQKHLLIWEAANGPVPTGHVVMFGNGDTTDVRLENLVLAEKADVAVMNHQGIKGYDTESTQTSVLTAKLIRRARGRATQKKEKA